jgi:hypothetical protein
MSGKTLTLLAIMAFVALTLGSFIWFIATWDKDNEASVTMVTPAPATQERLT